MSQPKKFVITWTLFLIVVIIGIISITHSLQSDVLNVNTVTVNSSEQGNSLNLESIKTHSKITDCWMLIDNEVYDVSSYINSHPGGPIIAQSCGTNGTEMFNTKGKEKPHSEFAHSLLKQFWIGSLNSKIDSNNVQNNTIINDSNSEKNNYFLPETLQSTLLLFNNSKILTYQFILDNNGKIYLVAYDNGTVTIKEGQYNMNITPQNMQFDSINSTCYNLTEIKSHSKKSNCWIIINNNVYDVTNYIPIHPGGESMITPYCGAKDATVAFNTKEESGNKHSSFAKSALATLKVGEICSNIAQELLIPEIIPIVVNKTIINNTVNNTIPTENILNSTNGYTLADIALHNKQSDCWLLINNKIYNVTSYIPIHPGGITRITSTCGKESSTAFNTRGGSGSHSNTAKQLLAQYYIADYVVPSSTGNTTTNSTNNTTITPPSSTPTIQQAIQAAYPGATITEINTEDNGLSEVHIIYQGNEMTVKLDSNNNII